jgi:trk system potassium uptake protein TrkH
MDGTAMLANTPTKPSTTVWVAPGTYAGGIKTTTLSICVMEIQRVLRGQEDLNLWDRRVTRDAVERSAVIVMLALLWCTLASALVGHWNPQASAADVIFECVSAFGTVGLSRGITSSLTEPSKVVIIFTMFCGRIGILTLFLTIFRRPNQPSYRLPVTRVPLG